MRLVAPGAALAVALAACASAPHRFTAADRTAVGAVLEDQVAAWNRGDLEAFCSVYSDDATFVSPSGTSQGRSMILDRYRAKYPDKSAMGTLTLEVAEGRAAGPGP